MTNALKDRLISGRENTGNVPGVGHVTRNAFAVSLVATILLIMASQPTAFAQDTRQMIRDAVAHHDQQEYDEAVALLTRVLELEPDNGLAAYELAITYQVAGDLQSCIDSATGYFALESDDSTPTHLVSELYTVLASCHSAAGDSDKGLEVFRTALELDPDNYGLNFNVAITLTNAGLTDEAIEHLGRAIKADPKHPSPYYVIAVLYQQKQQNVPAVLAFMSFLQREFNTQKCNTAARGIFDITYSRIRQNESDDGMTINVDPIDESVSMEVSALSLALSIAAAASAPGGEVTEPISDSLAGVLETFISVVAETEKATKSDSVLSTYLIPNISRLQAADVASAFSYFVVRTAGVDGADEWLDAHPDKVDALVEYFSHVHEYE
jgi:tetratricopeptide (TPR) repeat protein